VNQLNEYTLNKKGEIRNRTFKEAKLVYDELFERYFILEQEHNQEEQDW
jgi:enolase